MTKVREAEVNVSGTDVTLTTTSETVVVSSGPVKTPLETHRVIVLAWATLSPGTGTTDATPRIRRGTAITGALVGEENPEAIKVATGLREPYFKLASEERAGEDTVEYSLTLQQAGATANGTVAEAGVIVLVL